MENELATEKQVKFMEKLGLEMVSGLTKDQAKDLISSHLESGDKAETKTQSPTPPASNEREEYEIGKRRVRSNALSSAIDWVNLSKAGEVVGKEFLMEIAKDFEEFILGRI